MLSGKIKKFAFFNIPSNIPFIAYINKKCIKSFEFNLYYKSSDEMEFI